MKPEHNPYRPPAKQSAEPSPERAEHKSGSYKFRARDTITWMMTSFWLAGILIAVGLWAIAEIVWLIRR